MADFMVLPRPAKNVQNGAGFSRETGAYWACRKGKSGLVPQREQLARTPVPPCQKEKSLLSRVPDHEGEQGQDGRERGIRARAWRGKSGLHGEGRQIPRRKWRASNKSLPITSRRKHERVSGCKSSTGRSAKSWFHS